MAIPRTKGEKVIDVVNYILLGLSALATLYPFLYVLSLSFSSNRAIVSGEVLIIPIEFNLFSYKSVINNGQIFQAMANSVVITIVGTLLCLIMTMITAYPLSKDYLKGKNIIMGMIVISMLFSAGIIPNYLLVRSLGLINTYWALWLPSAINAFNMIIMRTFFQQVPVELEESAVIDGCNEIMIMIKIIIPLSTPVIATIALFYAVGYWNNFFAPFIFITKSSLMPLPVRLRQVIMEGITNLGDMETVEKVKYYTPEAIKAATIVVSTVPILIVYPFLQRYFVKGVTIGAIKG